MFFWNTRPGTGWHCYRYSTPLLDLGKRRTAGGNTVRVTDYDGPEMAKILGQIDAAAARVVIELVATRPGVVGQQDALSTGVGFGRWLGILDAYGLPYRTVPSHVWRREVFSLPEAADLEAPPQPDRKLDPGVRNRLLNQRRAVLKRHSCILAARLFPACAEWFRHHTTQDGIAEAALLAVWLEREAAGAWDKPARKGRKR